MTKKNIHYFSYTRFVIFNVNRTKLLTELYTQYTSNGLICLYNNEFQDAKDCMKPYFLIKKLF